jgi:hypothetical protein
MVGNPDLSAIGAAGDADGIDSDGDAPGDAAARGDHIDSAGWGVGNEDPAVEREDRRNMWTFQGGVAHFGEIGLWG